MVNIERVCMYQVSTGAVFYRERAVAAHVAQKLHGGKQKHNHQHSATTRTSTCPGFFSEKTLEIKRPLPVKRLRPWTTTRVHPSGEK